jgi:hypothetical protein
LTHCLIAFLLMNLSHLLVIIVIGNQSDKSLEDLVKDTLLGLEQGVLCTLLIDHFGIIFFIVCERESVIIGRQRCLDFLCHGVLQRVYVANVRL